MPRKRDSEKSVKKRELSDILEELDGMRKRLKEALSSPTPSSSGEEEEIVFVNVGDTKTEDNTDFNMNDNADDEPPTYLEEENGDPILEDEFKPLGAKPPMDDAKLGAELHNEIVIRWQSYLVKGVSLEERKKIVEKYDLPANCQQLLPPKVNEEILACLPDTTNKHDRLLKSLQYQLGHGLSAIGKVMDLLLKEKNTENLTCLADSAQLFANVHNAISVLRKQKIAPFLNSEAQAVALSSSIDDKLFGSNFEETLKAKQNLKKASIEIKKKQFSGPLAPKASTSGLSTFNLPKPIQTTTRRFQTNTNSMNLNYQRGVFRYRMKGRGTRMATTRRPYQTNPYRKN
ncbi:uncharacterized protein LOC126733983 [Anthonomus grandis grandis]|uniref:uncharacterized protein LOC126733983 n=1 Tax=Anthonomus grandis grandis TaxID=2921223 RepID=UPI00216513CE|nr:uncharacterized protein LOC126733983 [Anthonomus grandis grandis]